MDATPENPIDAGHEFTAGDLAVANFSADSALEGAGAVGGSYNAIMDIADGDWGGAAAEGLGVGLDMLGMAMNPLQGFTSAGIGWVIEHLGFLKEGLDLLAGDPAAVSAQAQTWTNIANALQETADNYEQSLEGTFVGSGNAAVSYSVAARTYADAVRTASTHAHNAAAAIHRSGIVVAVIRSLIRDMIADWVADRCYKWVAAQVLTAVSFGATQAAFTIDTVMSAARLSGKIGDQLTKVANKLEEFGGAAAKSASAFRQGSASLDDLAQGVTGAATKFARQQNKVDTLSAQRRAAGQNIQSRKAGSTRAQRARAHEEAVSAERNARRQLDEYGRQLTDAEAALAEAAGNVPISERLGEAARDAPMAAGKGVKEVTVQASNDEERKQSAAEEGTWRMRGSIE